ncbi:4-hydroxyphenylacetate decarboxylase activating enzyme [Sporomusa termitida]|uniref:4-hydroxyphenylacetate decarboxylase activating enzyme n=2 Tax=Sporomusa termitida TaxID=2377 RepID=A0A517DX95_9FIRM|nr:4-hydroxyphenylacetate decarboxylase activating enzyme [Sporomusa termitida]
MQDGPGIRTTVFLKGCTLHCPWCANPENIRCGRQYYFKEDICSANRGKSVFCAACPGETILKYSYADKTKFSCPFGAIGVYGKSYKTQELVNLLLRDKAYWKETGGITFSGGEPLLQAQELKRVLMLLKESNIHIVLETALHVPIDAVKTVSEYVDLLFVDLKILDEQECKKILGGQADLFKNNVRHLAATEKKVIFRIPCSNEFTLKDSNSKLLKEFIHQYNCYPVEIFSLHNFANSKYRTLGLYPPSEFPVDLCKMERLATWINETGGKASVISI